MQKYIALNTDVRRLAGNCDNDYVGKMDFYAKTAMQLEEKKLCSDGRLRDCEPLGHTIELCYSVSNTIQVQMVLIIKLILKPTI